MVGLISILPVLITTALANINPLDGRHLRVLACEFPVTLITKRNSTGHVIFIDGILKDMLETLSRMLNFSYTYLPVLTPHFDDSPTEKGSEYYLVNDEADYSLSTTTALPNRFKIADFPATWYYGSFCTLIPYPASETLNLTASFKPLSYPVWILIAVAAFVTILYLGLMQRNNSRTCHQREIKVDTKVDVKVISSHFSVILYVMGNLVSQGQYYSSKRLAVRVAAGAWCCGCFFLVQIYSSTLTSHLTSHNQKSIIKSFFDIADTPGIILTLDKGYALDSILKATESERIKRFVDILRNDGRLITCKRVADCLKYVKDGNAVYSSAFSIIKTLVDTDFKTTGNCKYSMTKETFWNSAVFTPLRKNSPYTKTISKGIMRLQETGLLSVWGRRYAAPPSKCKAFDQHRIGKHQLSFKHLSSAFAILIIGYILSAIVFAMEKCFCFIHKCCAN